MAIRGRTKRRVVGAMLLVLVTASLGLLAPTSASAVTCGSGGCGPYRITYVYAGGGTAAISYASDVQWAIDATHGAQRGYLQQSGYVKMTVSDGRNGDGMATTATFCATGNRCIGTYGNGVPGQTNWAELDDSAGCKALTEHSGAEASMWAYYLTGVAYTTVGIRGGASIAAGMMYLVGVGCD